VQIIARVVAVAQLLILPRRAVGLLGRPTAHLRHRIVADHHIIGRHAQLSRDIGAQTQQIQAVHVGVQSMAPGIQKCSAGQPAQTVVLIEDG